MDDTSKRVYIVEDEAIIAADIAERLRALGFAVTGSTGHGERALNDIPELRPDIVLMDIVIKGPINGIETARRLRAKHDVPVVFLTSHADAETVRQAVGSNPYGYVLKPYNDRELQVAIQIALHRHGVESRLRGLERWMATVLASIADGVLATDRTGRVTLLNDAARRLTGWHGDDAIGQALDQVFAVTDDRANVPVEGLLELGMRGPRGSTGSQLLQLKRRDGVTISVTDSLAPIRDDDGKASGIVVVFRDATEQLKVERMEREKLAAELASRQKTHFLSRVSHELRTPLNAILGFSQLMALDREHPLDPSQRARLDKVRHAGDHLLELINDVLELTRLDEGARPMELQAVDLLTVLSESAAMLEGLAAEHGVTLRLPERAASSVVVLADRRAVEQVLLNLLSNGIKYNRRGGVLDVAVRPAGERIELTVTDQGEGLDASRLDQLFQPFNRLGAENSAVGGIGLGLVIARSLTEAMNGSLVASSTPGVGTCFTFSLPEAPSDSMIGFAALQPARPLAPALESLPPATLLYVEDEPLNALLVTEALRAVPQWRIVLADDGEQGLAMARALLPDIVLLDINLPKLTGDQVLAALRRDTATAGLRCIALSANAMEEQRQAALAAGFDDYWTKPLDLRKLIERLGMQLARVGALRSAA